MLDCSRNNHRGVRRRAATVLVVAVALAVAAVSAASGESQRASVKAPWILFSGLNNGTGTEQIYRIKSSGQGLRQLTKGSYPSEAPAFSPSGKRVAFARLGVGILTMNVDGTGLRRLTTNVRDSFPVWSPNGKQIAFIRPLKNGWKVHVMSATGAGARPLRLAPPAGRPSWTAGGLVIPTGGDLARIDPRTGRVQKLFGAVIDAATGMTSTTVAPNLSNLTFVGPRPPIPGDKDCGEGEPCPRFGLYIESLPTRTDAQLIVRDTGPAAYFNGGRNLAFVALNKLFFRNIKTGKTTAVAPGTVDPTTGAPPAVQPR
jgi:hypothetical protein